MQRQVLRHLAEQAPSLPVPRIIAARDGSALARALIAGIPYNVRVVSFIEGELAAQRPASVRSLQAIGGVPGATGRGVGGFFPQRAGAAHRLGRARGSGVAKYVDYLDSTASRRLVRLALNGLNARLGALRGLRAQAVHGDCHPRNLLLSSSGDDCMGILDFGDMIHAPVVLEPAVAMAELSGRGRGQLRAHWRNPGRLCLRAAVGRCGPRVAL